MSTRTVLAGLSVLTATVIASAAVTRCRGYTFQAYVTSGAKWRGRMHETHDHGRPLLKVREGDEYAIIVRNPLPVRVGVAVSVDGLNTIDGKRSKPAEGPKWIIEPHGTIAIRGWQTGSRSLRTFVFTRPEWSYASWKEEHDHREYTRNLGVIGVAWFWSSEELALALHPPRPFAGHSSRDRDLAEAVPHNAPKMKSRSAAPSQRAGTGMGDRRHNHVTKVAFDFDTGMYANADVLKIYYEFAIDVPVAQPFEEGPVDFDFAPEMPR